MIYHLFTFFLLALIGEVQGKTHPFHEFTSPVTSWALCRDEHIPPQNLTKPNLIVLSPKHYVSTFEFMERGQQLYGYFDIAKSYKQPSMEFTQYVKEVLEETIPKILFKRIMGVFIYNSSPYFSKEQEKQLILSIIYHYPYLKIMLPSTSQVLSEVVNSIDVVVFDGFFTEKYVPGKLVAGNKIEDDIQKIRGLRKQNNELLICSIEYVDPNNGAILKEIQEKSSEENILPYYIENSEDIPFFDRVEERPSL